ncbi:MAG: hypothetical protein GY768_31325 [Planctomycetaceae bacterium]|nr:hypothetical protein [Planctomycetaceae bacterium]
MTHSHFFAGFLTILLSAQAALAQLPKMYWSDRGANTIRRADVDGTGSELLASGMSEVRGVAVDFRNRMLYWADNGADRIQRAPMDGGIPEDLVTTGLRFPAGIVLDLPSNKMYWADALAGKIQRANLDGSNVEDLATGLGKPYFLRLDFTNQHIYWTDYGTDKIQRSDFDGANLVDLVTTGLKLPRGIDLDVAGGKMYWADRGTDRIQRANLDGSNVETLHTVPPHGVDAAPHGVALDIERGHLYWVDNGLVTIQRSNLDGSGVTNILTSASGILKKPWEIVLDLSQMGDPGCDFDGDGLCAAADVDALTRVVIAGTNELMFDLNRDKFVNQADRISWVKDSKQTYFGDADLNGKFDTSDLVTVFAVGRYEDSISQNAGWADGDWDGDLDFTSSDLVWAFRDGGYEQGPLARVNGVPEPRSLSLVSLCLVLLTLTYRRTKPASGGPIDS